MGSNKKKMRFSRDLYSDGGCLYDIICANGE